MNLPHFPNPEETYQELDWLLREIYYALEWGAMKSKEIVDADDLEFDGTIWAGNVRAYAKNYLQKKEFADLKMEHINNAGLWLQLPNYGIRIWKANDQNPPASKSDPRQAYCQQLLFTGVDPLKLIIIWNSDKLHNLSRLWLVCPKYADEESVEAHWIMEIKNPGLSSSAPPPPNDPGELPIEPKQEDKKKENG
ncbi:hypothetical protein L0156_02280 [bacterium]|nr:hypothetical protein [bacterium]